MDKIFLRFALVLGIVAVVACGIFLVASDGEESPRPLIISVISLLSILAILWYRSRYMDGEAR